MTPKELAEKILNRIKEDGTVFYNDYNILDCMEPILFEALEEAVAESRKSAAFIKQTTCAKLIKQAKSAAYEECAKIAEGYCSNDELLHEAFKLVADKIRQLKEELK